MHAKYLNRYRWRLLHRLPLIGGWLQGRAARALAADGSPAALQVLADVFVVSKDPRVRELARQTLARLDSQAAVDAIAFAWTVSRNADLGEMLRARGLLPSRPPEVRLLVALKLGRLEAVHSVGADTVLALVQACDDPDALIAAQARAAIPQLTDPAAIQIVCIRWAETRSPHLEVALLAGLWVALEPLGAYVLTALKTRQGDRLRELGPEGVEFLLRACTDPDPVIAAEARLTLRHLRSTDAQEAVCRLFLERDDPQARAAALEGGYLPHEEHQRALFLFLTEQWDRYQALDFDSRLLFAVHEAASADLRTRILEKLRTAGRTDFLTVLAGRDYRSRAGRMTAAEADVLVQMLASNREWDKLWSLLFELPLRSSVAIVRILARQDWQPQREDERATFEHLAELAAFDLAAGEELGQPLPPAALRARARVSGRVNDVAFSPRRPLIAIGTGRRKVVLWNYQKGAVERVHGGFKHSIGRVAFTHDDVLLCSERSQQTGKRRTLYGWSGENHFTLAHRSTVTALEPMGASQALIAFRDERVALFDPAEVQLIREQRFPFWCRAVGASPDGTRAALLHQGITLASVPELDSLASTSRRQLRGVLTCAAFTSDGTLIAGKYSGDVVVCRRNGDRLEAEARPLLRHAAPVQEVALLQGGSVVLSASTDGSMVFTSWPERAPVGKIQVAGERLTSLHLSPDGDFMAVGDSDASMSLWDLRVLGLPLLLARPFALAMPIHLAAVNALVGDAALPHQVDQALRFVQAVLQHRFRYDIEVDEMTAIQAGEFDIEIA
jgi:hypothetical protein